MAHVNFKEVSVIGVKQGKCNVCGKSCKVKKKFYQTINPFNRNSEGFAKTKEEILIEITKERDSWQLEGPQHKKCEAAEVKE